LILKLVRRFDFFIPEEIDGMNILPGKKIKLGLWV